MCVCLFVVFFGGGAGWQNMLHKVLGSVFSDIRVQGFNHCGSLIMDCKHEFRCYFDAITSISVQKCFFCLP